MSPLGYATETNNGTLGGGLRGFMFYTQQLTVSELKPIFVNYYQGVELLNAKDTLMQAVN